MNVMDRADRRTQIAIAVLPAVISSYPTSPVPEAEVSFAATVTDRAFAVADQVIKSERAAAEMDARRAASRGPRVPSDFDPRHDHLPSGREEEMARFNESALLAAKANTAAKAVPFADTRTAAERDAVRPEAEVIVNEVEAAIVRQGNGFNAVERRLVIDVLLDHLCTDPALVLEQDRQARCLVAYQQFADRVRQVRAVYDCGDTPNDALSDAIEALDAGLTSASAAAAAAAAARADRQPAPPAPDPVAAKVERIMRGASS